jgi:hypothetical protein
MQSVQLSVAKRLTSFRLQALRTLALRALECHYKHLPDEVREKIKAVVEAILSAEEACVAWVYSIEEEKNESK